MPLSALQHVNPIVVTSAGLTTSSTAYVTGDMMGTEGTITGAAAATGGSGVITGISIEDHAKVIGATTLFIANAASTPAADNAANSWSDTNMRLMQIVQAIPTPVVSALNNFVYVGNLWLPFDTNASANLFLNVVTNSGHTFFGAVGDLQFTFHVLQWV